MPRSTRSPSLHLRTNRRFWDRSARSYEARNRRALSQHGGMAWGFWRLPESRLHLLGEVRGKEILEVGCGAGRWGVGLRRIGARPVGVDFSRSRIEGAARVMRSRRIRYPLVQADAERLPFPDARFDVVFCDWGALTFARPGRAIPEAARVLRDGGRLVFSNSSPFRTLAQDRGTGRVTARLRYPYFPLDRVAYADGEVNFQLPYSGWVELFRRCDLMIERMIETPAPARGKSPYVTASEAKWGRHWPLETIWALRKLRADALDGDVRVKRARRTSARR